MRVKRYVAKSMSEALQMVKADLGSEAVIVHSRPIPLKPWLRLVRRPELEVVAAIDAEPSQPAAPVRAGSIGSYLGRTQAARYRTPDELNRPIGLPTMSAADEVLREVRQDVADLKGTLGRLAQHAELPHIFKYAPRLVQLHEHLLAQDVEAELADNLIAATDYELSCAALQDLPAARACLTRQIIRLISTRDPLPAPGEPSRTIFLVGPTGVGKTTTLAKLAANFALGGRGKVALVTTDTFRIAAIPQLQTYAEIIQVPLDVVYSPSELRGLLRRHQDKRLVLVDTPGRSPANRQQIRELGLFTQVAPERVVLLTVAASTKPRDLAAIVERFGEIPFDGFVVTKVDETRSFGPIVGLLRQSRKPLTFLTTGQQVPQDIETATPTRLAELVLGSEA